VGILYNFNELCNEHDFFQLWKSFIVQGSIDFSNLSSKSAIDEMRDLEKDWTPLNLLTKCHHPLCFLNIKFKITPRAMELLDSKCCSGEPPFTRLPHTLKRPR